MLHVRVHDDDGISFGIVEACHHGNLFAVVAREVEVVVMAVLLVKFNHLLEGVVLAAIINKEELPIVVGVFCQHLAHACLDEGEGCFLVVGW